MIRYYLNMNTKDVDHLNEYFNECHNYYPWYSYKRLYNIITQPSVYLNIKDSDGQTDLIRLCRKNEYTSDRHKYVKIVTLLIKNKADVNIQDDDGYSALIHASIQNNVECVNTLIDNQADINLQDKKGYSALMHVCRTCHKNFDITKLLMSHENTDLGLYDVHGMTILMYACYNIDYTDTIAYMLCWYDNEYKN